MTFNQVMECVLNIVNGNWGHWGPFGRCNAGCKKMRKRLCNDPPPSENGGKKCSGTNSLEQVQVGNCDQRFCGKSLSYDLDITRDIFKGACINVSSFLYFLNSLRKRYISEGSKDQL